MFIHACVFPHKNSVQSIATTCGLPTWWNQQAGNDVSQKVIVGFCSPHCTHTVDV